MLSGSVLLFVGNRVLSAEAAASIVAGLAKMLEARVVVVVVVGFLLITQQHSFIHIYCESVCSLPHQTEILTIVT